MPENLCSVWIKVTLNDLYLMRRGTVASTPQGETHPEVVRMGRSATTLPFSVSQNAGDLVDEKITNNPFTKFAFRSSTTQEIRDILTLLGVKKMKDTKTVSKAFATGSVMAGRFQARQRGAGGCLEQELFDTFNTNPETEGKIGFFQIYADNFFNT